MFGGFCVAEQYGRVVEVRGKTVDVQVLQAEACAHCQLCNTGKTRLHVLEMSNTAGAELGDIVLLESPARELMLASFVAWLVPLFAILAGIAGGYFVGGILWPENRDIVAAIAGLAMLPPGFAMVKRAGRLFGTGKMLSPTMVRVVGIDEPGIQALAKCNREPSPGQ